ncbi:hypothetical protein ACFXKJ_30855 [Kitasatospora indigofera]|uniref:hypothetical protein n=1 Tax=Kitasatospora indigofera TaxID=67307 RepID=UPI0036773F76
MSRTISHIRHRPVDTGVPRREHRGGERPWRRSVLRTLRYSAARLDRARAEGRRPHPERIRLSLEIHCYGNAFRDSAWTGRFGNLAERGARQATRLRLREILLLAAFEDAEVEPTRHRHGVLWDSW